MKKVMFFAAAAATMAVTSCSNDSVLNSGINSESNKITFTNATNALTKNAVNSSGEFETQFGTPGFGIVAFSNEANFDGSWMGTWNAATSNATPDKATLTSGSWATANEYFWPEDATNKLSFLAVAPYSVDYRATKADGLTVTDFTPNAVTADQVDLMYAGADSVANNAGAAVALNFQHALTAVQFTAQVTNANVYANISAIEVVNLSGVGTFNVNANANTVAKTDDDSNADSFTNDDFTWTVDNTQANKTASYSNVFAAGNGEFGGANYVANRYALTDAANPLMLVPQSFTKWDAEGTGTMDAGVPNDGGTYVALTLALYVYDPADLGTDGVVNGNEATTADVEYLIGTGKDAANHATVYIPLGEDGTLWAAGNRVTYNISLDGAYTGTTDPEETLDLIKFSATAQPWDDVSGGNIGL